MGVDCNLQGNVTLYHKYLQKPFKVFYLWRPEVRYFHRRVLAGGYLGQALVLGQYIIHDPELKDKHTRG